MRRKLILSLVAMASVTAPAFGETSSADGKATAYSHVMRPGEECETGAAETCKPGLPCFARIVIEGQAARLLYDAMKLHPRKFQDADSSYYFGTQTDAMTCWETNGVYSCDFGYDAVANVLSQGKSCQFE